MLSKNVFKIIFKWQNLELCTDFENGSRPKFQRKSITLISRKVDLHFSENFEKAIL